MASSPLARVSFFLVLVLSQSILLESLKINSGIFTSSSSVMIALNLDVKIFPSRNTPGFSRTSPATQCPLAYKITQGIYIVKVSLASYYLVLLSGVVNPNSCPVFNSHNFEFPKARGLKLAHLNVRSLVNKIDDVRSFIDKNPFDIFTISESG